MLLTHGPEYLLDMKCQHNGSGIASTDLIPNKGFSRHRSWYSPPKDILATLGFDVIDGTKKTWIRLVENV